ncbi:MAG TPA: hypothetical protein VF183_04865 [Acidimicrobiales bacterium]
MIQLPSTHQWFENLTAADRAVLRHGAAALGYELGDLERDADALAFVLAHRTTYDAIFAGREGEALVNTSPFLVFAVIVHRTWAELQDATVVEEWVGVRQRLPVLGAGDLRDFLASAPRRFFLVELLASYTRVVSGSTWVQTRRGWQRRRFSELDPVRLASLLEAVPDPERAGVYRRLGDLALFLTGVFPDNTAQGGLAPIAEERLLRLSGLRPDDLPPTSGSPGAVGLLEHLGERWYRLALRSVHGPIVGSLATVAEVADRFTAARRTLNVLTDRFVFPLRAQWFGNPAA